MIMAESTNKAEDDKVKCKVLIVGAGMAGLSAANHLLKNHETDFFIVEARGRIGGRIVATKIGEFYLTYFRILLIICRRSIVSCNFVILMKLVYVYEFFLAYSSYSRIHSG